MASFQQKLNISIFSGATLGLINLPQTFKMVDSILPLKTIYASGCPNFVGQLLHLLVFAVVSYISMPNKEKSALKLKHTLYGALIAFFVMSPAMFKLTGTLLGSSISNLNGCPSVLGVILHTLVYVGALVGVMYLPN